MICWMDDDVQKVVHAKSKRKIIFGQKEFRSHLVTNRSSIDTKCNINDVTLNRFIGQDIDNVAKNLPKKKKKNVKWKIYAQNGSLDIALMLNIGGDDTPKIFQVLKRKKRMSKHSAATVMYLRPVFRWTMCTWWCCVVPWSMEEHHHGAGNPL